jgi:hypothetical protein
MASKRNISAVTKAGLQAKNKKQKNEETTATEAEMHTAASKILQDAADAVEVSLDEWTRKTMIDEMCKLLPEQYQETPIFCSRYFYVFVCSLVFVFGSSSHQLRFIFTFVCLGASANKASK